ncbi:cell division protein PerM [Williamsia maris]|uniref:Uncharacterized protein n=1 Tax=Williamsia maris TaxID=72806 RepID=A0ABT1H8R4_9NOCA|nr:DUF6350 family protein [Williamsia maris]MCP2174655.1 hypothetical protein [Williamsia maris]
MVTSTGESLSTRLRELRRAQRRSAAHSAGSARELVVIAFGPSAIALLVIAVIALATLLSAGSGLTGLTAAIGAMWLSSHQVPLTISEVTIGVLPLAPTIALVAGVAAMTAGAAGNHRPRSELTSVFLAAVAGPLLITVLSLALVMDGSTVLTVASPNALVAFAWTIGLHALGAGLGLARGRWREVGAHLGVAPWAPAAFRAAGVALVGLFSVATLVIAVRLVVAHGTVGELIDAGHGFAGGLGLTVLSILYLPNLIIGAAAMLVGADAHVGTAGGDLFAAHGGSLPPLPVLAVLPSGGGGPFGAVLLVLTAVVALLAGRCALHVDPMRATRTVAATAGLAAIAMVVLTWLGGGELGELGSAGATVPAAGMFTFGWFAVVGMVMVLIHGVLPGTRAARAAYYRGDLLADVADDEDRLEDEYDDDREVAAHDDDELDVVTDRDPEDAGPRDGDRADADRDSADDRVVNVVDDDDEPASDVADNVTQMPRRARADVVFGTHRTDSDDDH